MLASFKDYLKRLTARCAQFLSTWTSQFRTWINHGGGNRLEPCLPPRPILIGLTLVLVLLAWLFLGRMPETKQPQAGLGLPGDSAPLKLNDEQLAASLPPGESLGKVEPAKLEVTESTTPALPAQPMLVQRPSSQPPGDLPPSEEPLFELIAALPHELETPMNSTKSTLAMQMFLFGWFLSNPAAPVFADEKKNDQTDGQTADRLGKIERDIADLKTNTAGLKDADLKGLREKVDGISKALEALDKLPIQVQNDTRGIRELKETVAGLKEAVTRLQNDLNSESRKAFSPASPKPGTVAPAPSGSLGTGTIKLVNAWSTPQTVVIDKESYRLQPGEVRNVTRKSGNFSYEVLGVQPIANRTLIAGESLTIRIGAPQ